MALLILSFKPESGFALGAWDELGDRVGWLLPRVRPGFGVQEVGTHERFFLRVMVAEMPSEGFRLTVFPADGADPRADERHPVWALVSRLAARNDWRVSRWTGVGGQREPVAIPPGALDLPVPEDHTDRLHRATPVPGVDLSDLDSEPWGELTHAFGAADDVPGLIRAVASDDPHARREAYRSLYGNLYHQGSTYPATVAAVPFFLRILAAPPVGAEVDLLEYLSIICERDAEVIRAVLPALPRLSHLAADPGEAALWARRLVACLARVSPAAADLLEGYVRQAPDPVLRADWLLWLGELDDAARWRDLLAEHLPSPDPLVRLASAISLLALGAATLPALDIAFDAVEAPEAFSVWSELDSTWQRTGADLGDIAFEHLIALDEEALAAAVAGLGGVAVAHTRWPSLDQIMAER